MDLYAVVGNPISHSISPYIHKAAFKKRKLNATYIPIELNEQNFEEGIQSLNTLNFSGFNITVPFKEKIIDLLDEIDEKSKIIKAVNTVKKVYGKLIGYNTDWYGFLKLLEEENIEVNNKNILIIGAGGSSKAVILTLTGLLPKKIVIINRTLSKALDLINYYNSQLSINNCLFSAYQLNSPNVQEIIKESDIIVNCTPVGLKLINQSPINLEVELRGKVIIDLIYNPEKTILLRSAEEKGAQIVNGLGMLIHQACGSFEIWTGKKAPIATMKQAALKAIRQLSD